MLTIDAIRVQNKMYVIFSAQIMNEVGLHIIIIIYYETLWFYFLLHVFICHMYVIKLRLLKDQLSVSVQKITLHNYTTTTTATPPPSFSSA